MNWIFAKNEGGRESGFHDAGVETFKGNLDRYLARELIQNSLDARLDPKKPVHMKFELLSLERAKIPGMDYLQDTYNRCAEYWKDDEKAYNFFKQASIIASQTRISALKVSDYNTTGVFGSDSDHTKNWYHLVRCAGSSSKWGGEGGSFGIGKNAPFAASKLRTVFYSTMTSEESVAFQGVSTIVSHKLPDGSMAQPTGFLGGENGESIRIPGFIPNEFRRKDYGLDIVILEYPAAATWQNDLVYSVLENFWPAIDIGDLIITVGEQTIDHSNLPILLNAFSGQEDFTAHLYYQAYKTPTHRFDEHLPTIHECSLLLMAGDIDLPKKVAMVRKTGMVIYQRGYLRSLIPFCGVFLCRNQVGNRALREMEPPRHDTWDPDHPERGVNKKIEIEYMSFIRECVSKLVSADNSKVISIPDLNRFLPDDDESDEESFESNEALSKSETSDRSPLPEIIPGRKIDPREHRMQPDNSKPDGEEEDTETGEGEGSGGGPGDNTNGTDGGTGSGGGGKGEGNAGIDLGGKKGVNPKPTVPIRYRTFSKTLDCGVYNLVISRQIKGNHPVNILISMVGDDQKVPASLRAVRLENGKSIPIVGPGIFGPIPLVDDTVYRIEVTLSEPIRVAMEVSAHET